MFFVLVSLCIYYEILTHFTGGKGGGGGGEEIIDDYTVGISRNHSPKCFNSYSELCADVKFRKKGI